MAAPGYAALQLTRTGCYRSAAAHPTSFKPLCHVFSVVIAGMSQLPGQNTKQQAVQELSEGWRPLASS